MIYVYILITFKK